MESTPPFELGLKTFTKFLGDQGWRDEIRWIWRDDILTRRMPSQHRRWSNPIAVDVSQPNSEAMARQYYELGRTRQLGVALSVFCRWGGIACCYVSLPIDAEDAERRMIRSLKCSIPDHPIEAVGITNPIYLWWLRRLRYLSDPHLAEIPMRSDVLAS